MQCGRSLPASRAPAAVAPTARKPLRFKSSTRSVAVNSLREDDHSLLRQLCGPAVACVAETPQNDNSSSRSSSSSSMEPLQQSVGLQAADTLGELHQSLGSSSRRLPRCSTVSLQTELACPNLLVFSGGTAFNSVAGPLRKLTTHVAHVLPVSDDGGSTAEIVRVIGGPAVGDIRSRCLRLADDRDEEARAVKRLLAHRLPGSSAAEAVSEWHAIVEGRHPLWGGVSEPYKHMIRAFLVHFQLQILSQVTHEFNFANGSIGNFFFAGARTFFRSLESAVFLFSRVARIPEGSSVLPAICTEEVITLGAELEDGTVIRGQNNISHPDVAAGPEAAGPSQVDKSRHYEPLPSPIRRVFYLSREGTGQEHEVAPQPNPRILQDVQRSDAVVYGMGSLYTSICPTLILDGVGEAIAARSDIPKVLLLNGCHDRETSCCGSHGGPMRASDVVTAITDALNRRRSRAHSLQGSSGLAASFAAANPGSRTTPAAVRGPLRNPPSAYVTTLLVPRGGEIEVDHTALELLGVSHVVEVGSVLDAEGRVGFESEELVLAIGQLLVGTGVLVGTLDSRRVSSSMD
uniref:Uncharacterized protein n=1 Tax=Tetradesmus obliquus TaxID=3088 RepID=A0A383VTG3_TETOB|eukprot:jgi/Sobl393_1/2450/SZX68072.1